MDGYPWKGIEATGGAKVGIAPGWNEYATGIWVEPRQNWIGVSTVLVVNMAQGQSAHQQEHKKGFGHLEAQWEV